MSIAHAVRRSLPLAAALVSLGISATASADAHQAVSGTAGKIAFTSNRTGGQDEIDVANADGSGRVDLNAQESPRSLRTDAGSRSPASGTGTRRST
jgi:hypothetical protein